MAAGIIAASVYVRKTKLATVLKYKDKILKLARMN